MIDDIANGGFAFVRLLQSIHTRAKKRRKWYISTKFTNLYTK
jgi:hypothetical protein